MPRTSGYFAPLVTAPTIIDAPGEYVTRCGEIVTVVRTSGEHSFSCTGTYSNGMIEGWHKSGRLYSDKRCDNDIVARVAQLEA
jgi:hypothetical protein